MKGEQITIKKQRRIQPKITRIQKIQQGMKNEGKWKEARQRQTKQ